MTPEQIITILDEFAPNPKPFLEFDSHYTLLVAVLLSAQTTDQRVNQVTKQLFQYAKTPEQMILLSVEFIESCVRPCGLGRKKAQAIWDLSQKLIQSYEGKVPSCLKDLETLPGVGHKTASVVLVQGFGKPAFPVDTHIFRCAKRWGLSDQKTVEGVEKDLKKVFPKDQWGKLHLQIIAFARQYCKARSHVKEKCPICSYLSSKP